MEKTKVRRGWRSRFDDLRPAHVHHQCHRDGFSGSCVEDDNIGYFLVQLATPTISYIIILRQQVRRE